MSTPHSRIQETAADWVVRINDPEATEADFDAWQVWVAQSPAHRDAYQALEHAWSRAAQVNAAPWPTEAELRTDRWSVYRLAFAAGIAVLIAGGVVSWLVYRNSGLIQTATAEQRSVRLDDGSRVQLGGETRVRVTLKSDVRALKLEQGEAYFEVTPDRMRPFIVKVEDIEVRALGTAFNIERGTGRTLVTVTQGLVRITQADRRMELRAGEQGEVRVQGVQKIMTHRDPDAAIAWRDGRLEYLHEELRYVLDDVNRYVERKIVINDPALAQMQFTGTVFLDHLDEWLTTLQGTFPVELIEQDKRRALVPARK